MNEKQIPKNFKELVEFKLKRLQQELIKQENTNIATILSCNRRKTPECEIDCEANKQCEKE